MILCSREESVQTARELITKGLRSQLQGLSRYQGSIESPWDDIAIRYVLVAHHIAKRRPSEAFKEHTVFVKFVSIMLPVPGGTLDLWLTRRVG